MYAAVSSQTDERKTDRRANSSAHYAKTCSHSGNVVPGCVFAFFKNAVEDVVASRRRISPNQSRKIAEAVKAVFYGD
jgi:hypothetical protein